MGSGSVPQRLLPSQILSNLVMEELLPELRSAIGPRLKGKAPERQRAWIQVGVVAVGTPGPNLHPPTTPCPHIRARCRSLSHRAVLLVAFLLLAPPAPSVPSHAALPGPPRVPERGKQTGGSPAPPRAKPSPAIFSQPFLGQRRLNPAQDLAKG